MSYDQRLADAERKVSELTAKVENQAARIRYLEGATNHATGTPLSRITSAYDALMGQIRVMKDRSDLYFKEAEAVSEEAEKHLRVFNVLTELERLGEAFRNR